MCKRLVISVPSITKAGGLLLARKSDSRCSYGTVPTTFVAILQKLFCVLHSADGRKVKILTLVILFWASTRIRACLHAPWRCKQTQSPAGAPLASKYEWPAALRPRQRLHKRVPNQVQWAMSRSSIAFEAASWSQSFVSPTRATGPCTGRSAATRLA